VADRLCKHGVAIESRVSWTRGGKSLYFRDPDNNWSKTADAGSLDDLLMTKWITDCGGGRLAGGAWWWKRRGDDAPQYQTTAVTRGDLTQVVTATARSTRSPNVQVGCQISRHDSHCSSTSIPRSPTAKFVAQSTEEPTKPTSIKPKATARVPKPH